MLSSMFGNFLEMLKREHTCGKANKFLIRSEFVKHYLLKICSLTDLVADVAKDEMESLTCSWVYDAEFDAIVNVGFWYESELFTSQKVRNRIPVTWLQNLGGNTTRAGICRIMTNGDVVPLINGVVFQDIKYTTFNEDWVFVI